MNKDCRANIRWRRTQKSSRSGVPRRLRLSKNPGELERAKALSNLNRARRRVRRVREDFCGGKSLFPEQKSFSCSFCARKSERFQQKLVGVCLHSYNDTVSANAAVIIEHRFAAIQQIRGCKFLTHTSSRSILIKTIPLCRHGQLSAHRLNGRVVSTKFCLFLCFISIAFCAFSTYNSKVLLYILYIVPKCIQHSYDQFSLPFLY